MMHTAAIVVPLHKKIPLPSELAALAHSVDVLKGYKQFAVVPATLALDEYAHVLDHCEIIRLPAQHFASVAAYSRLMLSAFFYERFSAFEYMLILQPDALVFRDELEYWCAQGFDYIGAPWPDGQVTRPFSFRGDHRLAKLLPWFNRPISLTVGNGGLSLRKISSARDTLQRHWLKATLWIGNEDMFWSLYSPRVPDEKQASLFALEEHAAAYYHANGDRLPFGCHAWEKHEPEFWHVQFAAHGISGMPLMNTNQNKAYG
jgi:hypothetical protein